MSHSVITEEWAERTEAAPQAEAAAPGKRPPQPGGSRELLALALPLVVSQGFMTVQIFLDTILLSWHDPLEMTASFPAVMWYWLPFGLLQVTAGYVSTFVAQYTGARRPQRVGPAVWQGIHFSLLAGLSFVLLVPAAPFVIGVGGHSPTLQVLEVVYLRCLCFAALPMLVMAAVNGFFSGRGQTWTVLGIEAFGTIVNILLASVDPALNGYKADQVTLFYSRLLDRVKTLPSVRAASLADCDPLGNHTGNDIFIEGYQPAPMNPRTRPR